MALPEPLGFFIDSLEALQFLYCVTGSVAAGIYGEPRLTRDVDLVLLLEPARLAEFRSAFPESEFYIPPPEVLRTEVLRAQRGSFNLIHHASGFKADVYVANKDPLHAWALRHRRRAKLSESSLWLAPPEYVVIRKLEFLREGRQEKHARDIRFILACTEVDRSFIQTHVQRLGLAEEWIAVEGGS